jgi:ribose transport system ATP-binding protein
MTTPLLEVRGIRKQYPGVLALDGVSLQVQPGEVLALVGENGAGKSTLMKILAGIVVPDAGELLLDGQPVRFHHVAEAQRRGIVLIHQELNLADNLSVAGNIFLGRERVIGGPLGWLARGQMDREARGLLQQVGLNCSPRTIVDTLKVGQQQLVEIARALGMRARLLIMDEPTSSLTQSETDRLCALIAELKQAGVAVVYISHRLAEVKVVADRVEVLRDGRNAGQLARAEITHDNLVRRMVGRDLKQLYPRKHATSAGANSLEVRDFRFEGSGQEPLSFTLRSGEIVGMGGLIGAGRTEIAEALFGLRRWLAGSVLLKGQPVRIHSPHDAVRAGVVLAPEDRRVHGLVLETTIRINIALPSYDQLNTAGLVFPGRESALAQRMMALLHVRAAGPGQIVGQLSGGNQQKVVLGKWLARRPTVLILDEPTRGVDVGAREQIYGLMDRLANEGMAILMISSDLEELLGMSDRLLVLHQGRLAGELARKEFSETAVMNLATGAGHATVGVAS